MSLILQLQTLLSKFEIDAYIIPGTDPHQSEYLPDLWKRREYASGFTGSAGELIISKDKAALWTDSRYYIQAALQLKGSGIELQKIGLPETPSFAQWLGKNLKAGQVVGIDSRLIGINSFNSLASELLQYNILLQGVEENLVDRIWKDQPQFPLSDARIHPLDVAGKSVEDKLSDLREEMERNFSSVHIISMLDAIAWLFNIRGNDVQYNPYVIAYAIVSNKAASLFVHTEQINTSLKKELQDAGVTIHNYDDFKNELGNIETAGSKIWLDGDSCSRWIFDNLKDKENVLLEASPIIMAKAKKNEAELAGIRAAHIRDGVAMVKFLIWFENNLDKTIITEISAAEKLAEFRSEQKLFAGLSFSTIAGYKEHGAIVHYESSEESDVELHKEGIFLLDSGGQYLDGTTDITRTLPLGKPTAEQKDRYTRVLKGHIAIASALFPKGTTGPALDTLARKPLWDIGLNYGHGTGHGVGAYLGVHEGPQGISYYRGQGVPILEGMLTSNEPGFYKEGEYGIRIENLIVAEKATDDGSFLKFNTITYCPIDKNLIEKELMTGDEINWLNNYHKETFEKLSPFLNEDEKLWLSKATEQL